MESRAPKAPARGGLTAAKGERQTGGEIHVGYGEPWLTAAFVHRRATPAPGEVALGRAGDGRRDRRAGPGRVRRRRRRRRRRVEQGQEDDDLRRDRARRRV